MSAAADLFFHIFARDDASDKFKKVGNAAEDAGNKILGMRKSTAALATLTALPLAAPMVSSMLALPGILGESAVAAGVLKVATSGLGDAFNASEKGGAAFTDAMKKLSPAGRAFVNEAVALKPALADLRNLTQDGLFGSFSGQMSLLAETYMPMLRRDVPAVARSLGATADGFLTWARSADTVGNVQRIIAHTGTDMRILGKATVTAADSFVELADAALPMTTRVLSAIERGTSGFNRWVTEMKRSGELASLFDRTGDTVDQLGQSMTLLGRTTANLFANPNTVAAANSLISVLNLGLKVVERLTAGFAALPGGAQQAILGLAAMALVSRQTAAATNALVGVTGRAATAMGNSSAKMKGLGNTLGDLGNKGGLVVGAIAGIGFALYQLSSSAVAPAQHNISKLSVSLVELGRSSRMTGEGLKVIGSNANVLFDLQQQIDRVAVSGNSFRKLVTGFVADTSALKQKNQLAQNFTEIDKALTQLVQGGQVNEANAAFNRLSGMWQEGGGNLRDLNSKLGGYRDAQAAASAAAMGAGQGFGDVTANAQLMAGGLAEAVRQGQKLTDVFTQLNGGIINFDHAQLAATEAIARFKDMVSQNGATLDRATLAGQRNVVSIEDMITAANQAAQAKLEESGSVEQATGVYNSNIAALRGAAIAAGFSAQQVDALVASVGQMPVSKATAISAPGAVKSDGEVSRLNAEIREIEDKLARVTVIGPHAATSAVGQLYAKLEALRSRVIQITINRVTREWTERKQASMSAVMRWGGVIPARHGRLDAHVTDAPTILYGERETGGEAFVPRRGNAARSKSILDEAASWYGFRLEKMSAGGVTGGTPSRVASGAAAVHVHFHGPVGSPHELKNWLAKSLDDLHRSGRYRTR